MAQSPLTTRVDLVHSSNYTVGREGCKIGGIVIHHACATTIESVARTFQTPGRGGSAHYTVQGNQISLMVDENNTSWHCGNWWGNLRTIGIETCNSALGGDWPIADDTMETLARLVADIAKRYGLGKLYLAPNEDLPVLCGHKDWVGSATACPGPYLYPRLQWLCDRANAINYPPAPAKPPKPQIAWKDLDKHLGLFTNSSARLIDLDTGQVKQTYTANTKINVVQTAEYDGKTWYRTEYSTTKGFNWAFEASMFVWDTPTQPEPSAPSSPPNNNSADEGDSSPNPSSNPESPSGENTNESKTDDSQDGSSLSDKNFVLSVLAKIMEFIKKIINLITKKGE